MSDGFTAEEAGRTRDEAVREIRWISHPVRTDHRKTLILALVLLGTAFLLYINTQSLGWALLSVVILMVGVYDFLLPTRYSLDEYGAESRVLFYRRHKSWSALRSFYPDHHGVLLSPFPSRSRLEGFRGMYLRFVDNREEVLRYIGQRLSRSSP